MSEISSRPIGEFLEALASRDPTPGGGAAAALHAAQAAALVAMVARYSDRSDDEAALALAADTAAEADALRLRSTDLIQADMDAFGEVAAAYRMPRGSDDEKAARSEAIAGASLVAARPPADVIEVAARVIALAVALNPVANRNVITDIAAAADAATAALSTARINVEINLGSVVAGPDRTALTVTLDSVEPLLAQAAALRAEVRSGLG